MQLKINKHKTPDDNDACIRVNGAKNALLPLMFASPLIDNHVTLTNAPIDIFDYKGAESILRSIGLNLIENQNKITIHNSDKLKSVDLANHLTTKTRCSIYLLGSLAKHRPSLTIGYPGGCTFGNDRNFDIHIEGLRALNAKITVTHNTITLKHVKDINASYTLPYPSVGATTNLILYSVIGNSTTHLKNCAIEPEIINVIDFLNACGGKIQYDTHKREIIIKGVSRLTSRKYRIIYDRIQVITYIALAILHNKNISIDGISTLEYMQAPLSYLSDLGLKYEHDPSRHHLKVWAKDFNNIPGMHITTEPYPGFPTDLQPIFATLALMANSPSTIIENVIPERVKYIAQLQKMNANISHHHQTITIKPNSQLTPACLRSTDLRGGMACLMTASLCHQSSIVENASQICRGYDHLITNLRQFMDISVVNAHCESVKNF